MGTDLQIKRNIFGEISRKLFYQKQQVQNIVYLKRKRFTAHRNKLRTKWDIIHLFNICQRGTSLRQKVTCSWTLGTILFHMKTSLGRLRIKQTFMNNISTHNNTFLAETSKFHVFRNKFIKERDILEYSRWIFY